MNQNRARDNELQRAIDEITRKAAPTPVGVPMDEPKPMAPVPPVPPVQPVPPKAEAKPVPPVPPVPPVQPVSPMPKPTNVPVPPSVSSIVAGAQPTRKPVEGPKPMQPGKQDQPVRAEMKKPEVMNGAETQRVKEAALKELFPIMDRLELTPEKKFALYRSMMEVMHDKAILKPAHEAAKEIKDDKKRADALLYLIETIEKFN